MHVASESGDYAFKKQPTRSPLFANTNNNDDSETTAALLQLEESLQVCGLYIVGEPDTIVEITMKHYDVNCESGGLMAVGERIKTDLIVLIKKNIQKHFNTSLLFKQIFSL